MTDICGIIFLDKPLGWTSRKAVNEITRLFSEPGHKRIKAGHTGTLDPLATGMLPILLGDATRFAEMNGVKRDESFRPENAKLAINRWILTELTRALRTMRPATVWKESQALTEKTRFRSKIRPEGKWK